MSDAGRRAVVTGASGFIGSALTAHLSADGWDVVTVDRRPFADGRPPSRLADVAQEGALAGLLDAGTVIFHMAASADVAGSVANPRHDFDNTFRGVFEVLEAARHTGSRVVFPSTASIFDASNPLPLAERAFPRPTSPYAAGKLGGEAYCHAYHRSLRRRRPDRAAVQRLRHRHVPLRDSRHHPQDSTEPRRSDDPRRRHAGARLSLHRRCGARLDDGRDRGSQPARSTTSRRRIPSVCWISRG